MTQRSECDLRPRRSGKAPGQKPGGDSLCSATAQGGDFIKATNNEEVMKSHMRKREGNLEEERKADRIMERGVKLEGK